MQGKAGQTLHAYQQEDIHTHTHRQTVVQTGVNVRCGFVQ